MPRGIQDSSKRDFVKKGKIHQAQKGTSALRQERSLESASKGPKSIKLRRIRRKNVPKSSFHQQKKKKEKKARQAENPKGRSRQKLGPKKKKKRKPARLKTQKGGLGISQGQRKEEEEEKKLEDPTKLET